MSNLSTSIRPFDWRDFGLVHRLTDVGMCFDAEAALTRGPHTLQSAILAFLVPGAGMPTYVFRRDQPTKSEGFAQMRYRRGDVQARLNFVATCANDDGQWSLLLDRVCQLAAARGAQNLVAEVDEHSHAFEVLRQSGFAIYTRQDIWRLTADAAAPARASSPMLLRAQQSVDVVSIQSLYNNIVPRLIQQVESPPTKHGQGFVFTEGGDAAAYFDVSRGPLGIWVQPYLHPGAFDQRDALMANLINLLMDRHPITLYVCARSHQDWLRTPLIDLGFELWAHQAVMVKRLAIHIGEPEFKPLPAVIGGNVSTQMIGIGAEADFVI